MSYFISTTGYILGAIIILCISMVYSAPVKTALKILLNSVAGCVFLSLSNLYLGKFGIYIGISPFTAVFTGILGIPGALAVIVLRLII